MFEKFKNLNSEEKTEVYKNVALTTLAMVLHGLCTYSIGVMHGSKVGTKAVLESIYEIGRRKE